MLRKLIVVAFVFMAFFMVGCEQKPQKPEPPSQAEQILKGEHRLRKMVERTEVNSRISGSFFLFVGDVSGSTKTTLSVKFAWEMNDGVYAISSLPLEKIRVRLDENTTVPTIKFRWRPYNGYGTAEVQDLMNDNVLYAVITVKESDWPVRVDPPLN